MSAVSDVNTEHGEALPLPESPTQYKASGNINLQPDLHDDSENEDSNLLQSIQAPHNPRQDVKHPNRHLIACNDNQSLADSVVPTTLSTSHLSSTVLASNRIGTLAIWTMALSTATILGSMSFLAFLWFSDDRNKTWHWIIVNDHLITIVTGLSKAVETSIQLQISLISAMLAAFLLERSNVTLNNVVSVSMTRLSGGSMNLLLNLWRQITHCTIDGLHSWPAISLMSLSAICLGFSQVVAILLNRNIGLVPVVGFNQTASPAFSFDYYRYSAEIAAGTPLNLTDFAQNGWFAQLSSFPAFAEYSKEGVKQTGVSDTGESIRAFLPYSSSSDRENMQSYRGQTTVVDVRVTCQAPQIQQALVSAPGYSLVLSGLVAASQQTPRLDNQTLLPVERTYDTAGYWKFDEPVPFHCMVPSYTTGLDSDTVLQKQWRIALCQLPEGGSETTMFSGGLISEFKPSLQIDLQNYFGRNGSEESTTWGQAYMFLNVTLGSYYDWTGALNDGHTYPVPAYQDRNEWKDLIFSQGTLALSATLCYTSFTSADIPIIMSSTKNRTEPVVFYNASQSRFIYDQVREQMGQIGTLQAPEDRGIFALEPQRGNWLANATELPPEEPYIRRYFNMKVGVDAGEDANWTAILWDSQDPQNDSANGNWIQPDPSIVTFFQEVVQNGGSVGFALQSLYTLLASVIYYKELPKFNAVAQGHRSDFKIVNAPTSKWGFFVVVGLILIHTILVAIVLLLFLEGTRWTYLGQSWISISQTRGEAIYDEVLQKCGVMSDSQIDNFLQEKGMKDVRVGLRLNAGMTWPEIVKWQGVKGETEQKPDARQNGL